MKDQKGDQVFGENFDEVLAEKIIRRTKENAGPHKPQQDTHSNIRSQTPNAKGPQPLLLLGVLVAASLLVLAAVSASLRKRS